ncbi:cor protein [Jejubacter calystegiae]|uniref:Cor protein n=1 Tax=Jejubacter calystegiae TaxID=2579935 RepID=A0A4P8YLP3_9ENTR|nr:cor protein [Jejubacter calystegiae]QCT21735.1 cor protein [Jejubacter calystegiae]
MRAIILSLAFLVAGCSSLIEPQDPVCEAVAMIGGQHTTVHIYGVRSVANQTQYKAGYPFNWRWVSKGNFVSSTCQK